jgi:hypothetical protein
MTTAEAQIILTRAEAALAEELAKFAAAQANDPKAIASCVISKLRATVTRMKKKIAAAAQA